jgi:hypothetical protein
VWSSLRVVVLLVLVVLVTLVLGAVPAAASFLHIFGLGEIEFALPVTGALVLMPAHVDQPSPGW